MENRILIVEDNAALALIYKSLFTAKGFTVQVAMNGFEAMRCLARALPDVVVLDLHLPEITGTDILNFIRNEERFVDTKVLIHSANDELVFEALLKADANLRKPCDMNQLLNQVSELLEEKSVPAVDPLLSVSALL